MDRAGLAEALTAARSRVTPGQVGLPAGNRRRVPGLRREELAMLAGISVDYLVRLEQGRGPHPSAQVLSSLARALRMTPDERDHLFHLAGAEAPRPGHIDGMVRPSTLRLLDRMTDLPVMVLDAKTDLLAWNSMAVALLGDFSALPPEQRNLARRRFLGPMSRIAQDPEEDEATAVEWVADLRAVAARYPADPDLRRLLDELRAGSPLFARLWESGRVETRRSSRKTVLHPEIGAITLDCDTLLLPDTAQRMIVYSAAPDSPGGEALALLRVIGSQELTVDR